jgi:Methylase involved in ubiquinone/menaquinone biosynthesis
MNPIIQFYEMYDEESRLQSRKSKNVEFVTTTKLLDTYFTKKMNILEVGAGSGIYSFYFAQQGHNVTATDLTPKHVAIMNRRLQDNPKLPIQIMEANATELKMFEDSKFDAALCLGPLYHLVDVDQQNKCISECLRVLKPGGIAAFAYIPRLQVFPYVVQGDRRYLTDNWMERIIDRGATYANEEDSFWTDAYYHTSEEIEKRLGAHSVETIDHIGTDGIAPLIGEFIDQLNDDEYEVWLKYHWKTCREPSILGMSNHALILCKKIDC